MQRYQWSALNKQQVGTFCEYYVKMEMTMFGLEVYSPEVDDRGIDFVARLPGRPFLEIQVKSLRQPGYVFMQKAKFQLRENLYLALGLLWESELPQLYLIPANAWKKKSAVFVSRDYDKPGQKSKPEWGINIYDNMLPLIRKYRFDLSIQRYLDAGDVEP